MYLKVKFLNKYFEISYSTLFKDKVKIDKGLEGDRGLDPSNILWELNILLFSFLNRQVFKMIMQQL